MSRTDTRVSRKDYDVACDNVYKLKQQNAALLEALKEVEKQFTETSPYWDLSTEVKLHLSIRQMNAISAAIAAAEGK